MFKVGDIVRITQGVGIVRWSGNRKAPKDGDPSNPLEPVPDLARTPIPQASPSEGEHVAESVDLPPPPTPHSRRPPHSRASRAHLIPASCRNATASSTCDRRDTGRRG